MKLQFFLNFINICYKKFYIIIKPFLNGKKEEKMEVLLVDSSQKPKDLSHEIGLLKRKSCAEVYATKEVLTQQILNELLQDQTLLKGVSQQDKVKFHQKLSSLLFSQFDSLVDRINKL